MLPGRRGRLSGAGGIPLLGPRVVRSKAVQGVVMAPLSEDLR